MEGQADIFEVSQRKHSKDTKSWLHRLFDSDLFDTSMAINYLFNSKEHGVLGYIGNKLFEFSDSDVDFYLPQLVKMYIVMPNVAEVLHPYMVERCRQSVDFSLKCSWLMEAYSFEANIPPKKENQNILKSSQKDDILPTKLQMRNLSFGRSLDNGCNCFNFVDLPGVSAPCMCEASHLGPQQEFVNTLVSIGNRLCTLHDRESKTQRLHSELSSLNLNLPARVWFPIQALDSSIHYVVRIPPKSASVLNSVLKAPYIIYAEVVAGEDFDMLSVPSEAVNSLRHVKSEVQLSVEMLPRAKMRDSISLPSFSGIENSDKDESWSSPYKTVGKIKESDGISQTSTESETFEDVRQSESTNSAKANIGFKKNPEDSFESILKNHWEDKVHRIQESSPYGHLKSWQLHSMIVKCGDDLRQELLANQYLTLLRNIWSEERVSLYVRPYRITVLSNDSGFIEPILNTVSLHQLKKHSKSSLLNAFLQEFGDVNSTQFLTAQKNFVQSCAAYCVVTYLIQVKDRHNANILLDDEGHLIHVDYGFILSSSPKSLGFERSPFKLTPEFVEVMGGQDSDMFEYFKILILQGLIAARKHQDKLISLVDIMTTGSQQTYFTNSASAVQAMKERFHLNLTENQLHSLVDTMVDQSIQSVTTKLFDNFHYLKNGIM